jgi:hypothetical protein
LPVVGDGGLVLTDFERVILRGSLGNLSDPDGAAVASAEKIDEFETWRDACDFSDPEAAADVGAADTLGVANSVAATAGMAILSMTTSGMAMAGEDCAGCGTFMEDTIASSILFFTVT